MFARATIGLLLLGLLAQADHAKNATEQQNHRKEEREQREQHMKHEKEEAKTAVATLEVAVKSDHSRIQEAIDTLHGMQQSLRTNYANETQLRSQVHRWLTAVRESHRAERAKVQHDFETAQQAAQIGGSQLHQVAEHLANTTGATAASAAVVQKQAQDTDSALGSQLELMATNIRKMRKMDREERSDARQRLHKFNQGLRANMKHHVKAARDAVRGLQNSANHLEREQRRAGLSEHVYEGTKERNEHSWEALQDQVGDIADQLQDSIDSIGDRMEDTLEEKMDKAHDDNERAVDEMRHQYKASADMAEQARHSMRHANKAAQQVLAKEAKNSTSNDVSFWSAEDETWSPAQACIAAVFIGAVAAFLVDRFRSRRQVRTPDGLVGLMA